jgi:hypothetical protein
MNNSNLRREFFVGWDVGAWNCDNNPNSRDAIVMLDADNQIVGQPWGWQNIRTEINNATTTDEWVRVLFQLCQAEYPESDFHVTMGIDTPLGFSVELSNLILNLNSCNESINESANNPYLFRQTERSLFDHGLTPLSAVKDMIGSQATKGMHMLSKYCPQILSCGVWTDGDLLTVIEAYPAPCQASAAIELLRHHPDLGQHDLEDALTCALVAYLFGTDRGQLARPPDGTPLSEGWIWLPNDVL